MEREASAKKNSKRGRLDIGDLESSTQALAKTRRGPEHSEDILGPSLRATIGCLALGLSLNEFVAPAFALPWISGLSSLGLGLGLLAWDLRRFPEVFGPKALPGAAANTSIGRGLALILGTIMLAVWLSCAAATLHFHYLRSERIELAHSGRSYFSILEAIQPQGNQMRIVLQTEEPRRERLEFLLRKRDGERLRLGQKLRLVAPQDGSRSPVLADIDAQTLAPIQVTQSLAVGFLLLALWYFLAKPLCLRVGQ